MKKFFWLVWLVSSIVLITLTIQGISAGKDGWMLFSRFIVWSIANVALFFALFLSHNSNPEEPAIFSKCPNCNVNSYALIQLTDSVICKSCLYQTTYKLEWSWPHLTFKPRIIACHYKRSNEEFVEDYNRRGR